MTNDDDGLPERIGDKVNELDIDFSNFTLAGWAVVLLTIAAGIGTGWLVYENIPRRDAMDKGRALLIGVGGLVTAIVAFFGSRWILQKLGVRITHDSD